MCNQFGQDSIYYINFQNENFKVDFLPFFAKIKAEINHRLSLHIIYDEMLQFGVLNFIFQNFGLENPKLYAPDLCSKSSHSGLKFLWICNPMTS